MNKTSSIIVSGLFLCVSHVNADIERISVSTTGVAGNGISGSPSVSANGRYVAFTSKADNLVDDDTNDKRDIFVHDRVTGVIERLNLTPSATQANDDVDNSVISANGRYVAFTSKADNLVDDDTNDERDVFVHDRETDLTERVSVSSDGYQADDISVTNYISADGRFIVFNSKADNLVDGFITDYSNVTYLDNSFNTPVYNTNVYNAFIHDRENGTTELISVSSAGEQGDAASFASAISTDGRFVLLTSHADNLVDGFIANYDTTTSHVFIRDRQKNVTELVSVSSSGEQANYPSGGTSISADGRYVAFYSKADNLTDGSVYDFNETDVYIHDRDSGKTSLVSATFTGENSASRSGAARLSANGRYITFQSRGGNLSGNDNQYVHIFVRDLQSNITKKVSINVNGDQADSNSYAPSISADGHYLAFISYADNLADGSLSGYSDIFGVENPLAHINSDTISIEARINDNARDTLDDAAQLLAGTRYKKSYKVTNDSPNRIYQVKVFENGNLACNFYALNPGESRTRCSTNVAVLVGDQNVTATVTAKVSGSNELLSATADAYYKGHSNVSGELYVRHHMNGYAGDTTASFATLPFVNRAHLLFKLENTGPIELYRVRVFHDPGSSETTGWQQQCFFGTLQPGEIRYCKRTVDINAEPGFHLTRGRAQGLNANVSATGYINAVNDTWYRRLAP